jgi:hypothetical protein
MSLTYAYGICRADRTPLLVAKCGNSSCIGGSCQSTNPSPACSQDFPNIYYSKVTCAGEGSRVKPDIQYTAYSDLTCTVAQQQQQPKAVSPSPFIAAVQMAPLCLWTTPTQMIVQETFQPSILLLDNVGEIQSHKIMSSSQNAPVLESYTSSPWDPSYSWLSYQ